MRVTTILKESITNAINKKAKTKSITLKSAIANSEFEYSNIIQDMIDTISVNTRPLIDKLIDDTFQKHPELYVGNSRYTTDITTKNELKQKLLKDVKGILDITLKRYISSHKTEKAEKDLRDFEKYVEEVIDNTIIELELGTTNKKQLNDLLNSIVFK